MTTRAEVDDALRGESNWNIRTALFCEEAEAFVIFVRARCYAPEEIRLAWYWFEEGYQCGLAMQLMRQLKRSAADDESNHG